jgi:hypothetical protein
MSGDSTTANHVEHEIATFPGSPGRPAASARKQEAEEDWGKRAVTELERKHLIETDRQIAECEAYIAKQRDLIERAIQQGRSTEVAEETLESLEASLRTLERQRQRLLDRLKERE